MTRTSAKKRRVDKRPAGREHTVRAKARMDNAGRRRKKRRGKRTLHYLMLAIFLLTTGTVLSMTVFFKIESVDVVGVDRYAPDDVAEATGIQTGDNLLRIDKEEISGKVLEQFPYIDSVKVRRKLPPAVIIEATQAQPAGAILQGEETLLIDRKGKVLERGVLIVPENIPIVKGIEAGKAQPGDVLGAYVPPEKKKGEKLTEAEEAQKLQAEETQEKLHMLVSLLTAMEDTGFESLTNVDLTDRLNIQVIYENRITLKLGVESQLDYKLSLIRYVLENHIEEDETGILDATDAAQNRVSFLPDSAEEGAEELLVDIPTVTGQGKETTSDEITAANE